MKTWFKRNTKEKARKPAHYSFPPSELGLLISQLKKRCHQRGMLLAVLAVSISLLLLILGAVLLFRDQSIVILHDAGGGNVWVTQSRGHAKPDKAATRSNLANYVRFRESYSAASYAHHYRQVNMLSSALVALSYRRAESAKRTGSRVQVLGRQGVRQVTIEDIILLPFTPKGSQTSGRTTLSYAEVHFKALTLHEGDAHPHLQSHTALIGWSYHGLPTDPVARLSNWMGFKINYYNVTDKQ